VTTARPAPLGQQVSPFVSSTVARNASRPGSSSTMRARSSPFGLDRAARTRRSSAAVTCQTIVEIQRIDDDARTGLETGKEHGSISGVSIKPRRARHRARTRA
jgi:hypothetical protein